MQAAARLAVVSAISAAALGLGLGLVTTGSAQQSQAERGKYLVTLGSCTDCHTPGYFFGKPDMARYLGGSEVGFEIPGLGVFHGPNLTPDRRNGHRQLDGGADCHRDSGRQAPGRPRARADHAVACVREHDQG